MIKNILNRIPRKQAKPAENRNGGSSTLPSNASTSLRTNFLTGSRQANSNAAGSKANPNPALSLNTTYEALPSFRDVPSAEKQNLFVRKLTICCVVFDFTDPMKNPREKDIKRQTMVELVDYVNSANGKFNETVMQEIVRMVSTNLFRTLFAQPRESKLVVGYDLEDDEPLMDPAWPHLQIVYEFFLRFVASPETDAKLAKRFIDQSFVLPGFLIGSPFFLIGYASDFCNPIGSGGTAWL